MNMPWLDHQNDMPGGSDKLHRALWSEHPRAMRALGARPYAGTIKGKIA